MSAGGNKLSETGFLLREAQKINNAAGHIAVTGLE